MIVAKVAVSDVRAQTVGYITVPAGIIGARVEFEFMDPRWDGLIKSAVFRGCVTKAVLLHGNTAVVPFEVVAQAGPRLEIGVCGVDADETVVIPTLWARAGQIRDSAEPAGDPGLDPSLPVWAEHEKRIQDLEESGPGGALSEEEIRQLIEEALQEAGENGLNGIGIVSIKIEEV